MIGKISKERKLFRDYIMEGIRLFHLIGEVIL